MRRATLLTRAFFAALLGAATSASAQNSVAGPATPESQKHFDRAQEWAKTGNAAGAAQEYFKAYQADTKCIRCAVRTLQISISDRDTKATCKYADAMLASGDPELVRYATVAKGHTLLLEGEVQKKQDKLQQADTLFAAWLAQHPDEPEILYDDGLALAHMNKDQEAGARFAHFAAVAPNDARHQRALRLAANPALGRARMAPSFTAKDINGQEVSLDRLTGRVVLVDFWATWCGPCNEELPHIKKIAQMYAGQPLTVISISWDDNEAKWSQFIAKNGMSWTQVRDKDHSITQRFGIDAIPHYFTIDTDGVLQTEQLGEGNDIDSKLKKMVAEAVKHEQQMQQAAQKPAM